ncbi:MAG: LysE family translocator [Actinobacteria bacterium]|nr:MAG: LysE family translocator [Actinomycetota bacterium]
MVAVLLLVTHLAAFFGVAALVIVTPGQDTALTIRNSLLGSRLNGLCTALGVSVGQCAWAVATSVGLAALLVASEPAFVALRLFGAAYLVLLGVQALRAAIGRRPSAMTRGGSRAGRPAVGFRQGLVSNLGNPKMAVFFPSLLPQFAHSFAALLTLGLVFAAMTLLWLSAYAVVVARAGDLLLRPRVRRTIDAVVGVVLVVFGVRLASEAR